MSSFAKSYSNFFSKKFQHICVSLDVKFNELLTNVVVSFEQLGPVCLVSVNNILFRILYIYIDYIYKCNYNDNQAINSTMKGIQK